MTIVIKGLVIAKIPIEGAILVVGRGFHWLGDGII